ncbi:MAG: hypothetical protein KDD69_18675 [Bdellovibrionales bacterium]|nr:hypothetical protein [Bdellovibrionales bacterium]
MSRETTLWHLIVAFAMLQSLLALTVWAARQPLGSTGVWISLSIAALKALLVLLVFMEVANTHRTIRIVVGVLILWFMIWIGLGLVDYSSRSWPVNPLLSDRAVDAERLLTEAKPL